MEEEGRKGEETSKTKTQGWKGEGEEDSERANEREREREEEASRDTEGGRRVKRGNAREIECQGGWGIIRARVLLARVRGCRGGTPGRQYGRY